MPAEKEGKPKKEKENQKKEVLGFFDEDISYSKSEGKKRSPPRIENAGEIRNVLKKLWEDKLKQEQQSATSQPEETFQPLQQLLKDDIATVRKDDVFASEVTKEEQDIIRQRVDHQRKALQEYERRMRSGKIKKINQIHPYVTEEEAIQTLIECNEDEEEAIVFLTDWFNLQSIRKTIAKKHEKANPAPVPSFPQNSNNNAVEDEDEEEKLAFIRRRKKKTPMKQKSKQGKEYTYRKLRLDDAIAQGNFEGWSDARIRAWNQRDKNPNAYYYRFNAPGESQRNGKWTKDEISLFYKRMKEVGVNGQWGIFSMTIPGRVGYQCSNFYRQLIETSQIKDENYVLDEKGKAHFVFKKGQRRSKSSGSPSGENDNENGGGKSRTRRTITTRKRKKKSKKDDDDEDELEDDDDEYRPTKSVRKDEEETSNNEAVKEDDNPLPGFVDPVTLCEVERPAISPYGHVMGYESWVRWLNQEQHRNVCPWTKKTVKKRDLVILTWENIDQYRDKIANWNKEGEKGGNNSIPM